MDFVSHFVDDLMRRGNVLRDSMVLTLEGARVLSCEDPLMGVFLKQTTVLAVAQEWPTEQRPVFYVVLSIDEETGHPPDVLWS